MTISLNHVNGTLASVTSPTCGCVGRSGVTTKTSVAVVRGGAGGAGRPGDVSGGARGRGFLKSFTRGAISRIGHRGQPGAVTLLYGHEQSDA